MSDCDNCIVVKALQRQVEDFRERIKFLEDKWAEIKKVVNWETLFTDPNANLHLQMMVLDNKEDDSNGT